MRTFLAPAALLVAASPALLAHPGHDGGLAAGLAHPLHGLDHVLAMFAVGLLAVRCAGGADGDRRALWLAPAAFMAAMLAGGGLALLGVPLPGAEWAIALSVLVLGTAVALAVRPDTRIACAVIALFALPHGHAHVAEMLPGAGVAAYLGGFLATTALLHAAGILAGWCAARAWSQMAVRWAGAGIAVAGAGLAAALV